MLRMLLILVLTVILASLGVLTGIYFYLKPDEPLARIASPSSVRMTDYGELVGYQGRYDAHAWLGIPYAQPPVRDLRWKAPRPPLPWTGRRETLEFGEPCVQLPVLPDSDQGRGYIGNEDCLYLNIWAPTIGPTRIPTGDDRLPVMFWIHGGGNAMGSGGSEDTDLYNGSLMVSEHDVIVVSVNYRMGPLGWFAHDALMKTSTTPEDASGNFGTLDLIAALRWVQANIHRFGGDPRRVTIFGESAGAATCSACSHHRSRGGFTNRQSSKAGRWKYSASKRLSKWARIPGEKPFCRHARWWRAGWSTKAGQSTSRLGLKCRTRFRKRNLRSGCGA